MVFLTKLLLKKIIPSDRFWKRRRILSQAGHFYGRRKNCYSFAVRAVIRSFKFETHRRLFLPSYLNSLYTTRVEAGCQENGTSFREMNKVLGESGIALSKNILQNLAVWEPRSFRGLTSLTKASVYELTQKSEGLASLAPFHEGVVTRGMIGNPIAVKSADGEETYVSSKQFTTNKNVFLDCGPDYLYLDGRPTPLKPEEKLTAIEQKENIEKAFQLKRELDFAQERFRKMKLSEKEDKTLVMSSKLKEKGDTNKSVFHRKSS